MNAFALGGLEGSDFEGFSSNGFTVLKHHLVESPMEKRAFVSGV
jgi:hypothetical protein